MAVDGGTKQDVMVRIGPSMNSFLLTQTCMEIKGVIRKDQA